MKKNKLPSYYQEVPPLTEAVLDGDYKKIKSLLARHANVNEENSYKITPLMAAAFKNDTKAVRILIEAKANLFLLNVEGKSALEIAHDLSYSAVKKQLLEEVVRLDKEASNYQNTLPKNKKAIHYQHTLPKDKKASSYQNTLPKDKKAISYQNTLRKDNADLYFSATQKINSIENKPNLAYKKTKDIKSSTPSLLLSSIVTSVAATTTGAIKYAVENISEHRESHHLNQIESSTSRLEARPSENLWWIAGAVTVSIVVSGIIGTVACLVRRPDDRTKNQNKSTHCLIGKTDDHIKEQDNSIPLQQAFCVPWVSQNLINKEEPIYAVPGPPLCTTPGDGCRLCHKSDKTRQLSYEPGDITEALANINKISEDISKLEELLAQNSQSVQHAPPLTMASSQLALTGSASKGALI